MKLSKIPSKWRVSVVQRTSIWRNFGQFHAEFAVAKDVMWRELQRCPPHTTRRYRHSRGMCETETVRCFKPRQNCIFTQIETLKKLLTPSTICMRITSRHMFTAIRTQGLSGDASHRRCLLKTKKEIVFVVEKGFFVLESLGCPSFSKYGNMIGANSSVEQIYSTSSNLMFQKIF